MGNSAVGGRIYVAINGKVIRAKGDFTVNYGEDKREAIVGTDGVHGYKTSPQVASIEGEITDRLEMDVKKDLLNVTGASVTVELANGKALLLRDAWYAGEGSLNTGEGNIPFRFEGLSIEEIR